MMDFARVVFCSDLRDAGLWDGDCCSSCHEDKNEGYITWMCQPFIEQDEMDFDVCCALSRYLNTLNTDEVLEKMRQYRKATP